MIQLEEEKTTLDQLYIVLRPFDIVLLTFGFPYLKNGITKSLQQAITQ